MRICYFGNSQVRVVDGLQWDRENGYVCEVDAATAAVLLTYPRPDFGVAADEPLLRVHGIGPQRAAELALAGIGSLAALAAVDKAMAKTLATETGASEEQILTWAAEARKLGGV